MSSENPYDFSTDTVPSEWIAAAVDAPQSSRPGGLAPRHRMGTLPVRTSLDMFTACIAGLSLSLVCGLAWYQIYVTGYDSPWPAALLGFLIAIGVRLGGGPADSHARGALALLFYLVTAALVLALVSRQTHIDLYGHAPALSDLDVEIRYSPLTQPLAAATWLLGAVFAVGTSRALR